MNILDIFQSTREKINSFLDFDLFDPNESLDQIERYMYIGEYLIHTSDASKDIYIDFSLAEANNNVFEKIQLNPLDMSVKINLYKEHVIKQTCQLFEEIYIHEDDIQRNIKKIGYLNQIHKILKTNERN